MRAFDFQPFFRSSVGFDRLFDTLDSVSNDQANGYPPYNIEKTADDKYRIVMAVAGFSDKDVEIVQQENALQVRGKIEDKENASYLHRGIATRAFDRRFQLADHIKVVGARLADGLLTIDLEREVPEEKKPRVIQIANGAAPASLPKAA